MTHSSPATPDLPSTTIRWIPYWLLRLVDAACPRFPVRLSSLRPGQAFTAIYEQTGYSGAFSGRVVRHGHGQVLVTYFAYLGGEPGIFQIWRKGSTPVWRRLTCRSLDRATM